MADTTPPVDTPTPIPSPENELKDLEKQLSDTQRHAERLKVAVAGQKKIAGDVDQKQKDFAKVLDDIGSKKPGLDEFVTREKKMLEAAVADKEKIQTLEKDALKDLECLKGKIKEAQDKVRPLERGLDSARYATIDARKKLDDLTGVPANYATILKDAAGLLDKANAEGKANNLSRMYFLVLALEDRLKLLVRNSSDQYNKDLNAAAAELAKAEDTELSTKEALDAAIAAVNEAQKNFDARTATWVDETLKGIAKGNGGTTTATPPAPATSPTTPPPTNPGGSEAAPPA